MVGTFISPEEARDLEQTFEKTYNEAGGASLLTPASMTCFQLNRLLTILNRRTAELQTLKQSLDENDVKMSRNIKKVLSDTINKLNILMKTPLPAIVPSLKSQPKEVSSPLRNRLLGSIDEGMPVKGPLMRNTTPKRSSNFNPNPGTQKPG